MFNTADRFEKEIIEDSPGKEVLLLSRLSLSKMFQGKHEKIQVSSMHRAVFLLFFFKGQEVRLYFVELLIVCSVHGPYGYCPR